MAGKINGLDHDTRLQLGAWLGRDNNTVYQAATDGIVLATASNGPGYSKTDNFTPPTTNRQVGEAANFSSCMPVRKNDYWKTTAMSVVWWIPLEILTVRP